MVERDGNGENVKVVVDEEYDPVTGLSFLHVRCVDRVRGFEDDSFTIRSASPEFISEGFIANTCFLDEHPPENFSEEKLKDYILFLKECAANVPGLKNGVI
jgi:hypothetical protein